ncbi:MAG: MFS transporter, partial [Bacteroidota bacterium]
MSYRWAVNFLFFANGFIYGNWAARIPRIQEVHALSNSQVGFILLAHSVGAFIAMPITGWLINRYGSHSVSWKAGILLISSLVLIPHVPSYVILLVPFFLVGAFSGTMDVAMNAQAVDVEKHYARPIITSFHALFSIGMFVGGLVSALFIREAPSLWIHLTVVGLTGAILVIAASRHLYVQKKTNPADDEVVFAFPRGPILALGIVAFCCMMGEGAIADWSTNYMKKIVGVFDLQTFGLVAFAGMMTVGRLLGDRGRARWGDRWMMVAGALCSLVGIVLVLTLWHPWVVIIGFGAVG